MNQHFRLRNELNLSEEKVKHTKINDLMIKRKKNTYNEKPHLTELPVKTFFSILISARKTENNNDNNNTNHKHEIHGKNE